VPLVVEDGTGLADADSYISLDDADTYHAGRSSAADWAGLSDPEKEAALRDATDYMVQAYRLDWKGTRLTTTQALDWPRAEVERADYAFSPGNGLTTISGDYYYPSDEVPIEVQRACASLALKASAGELLPDLGQRVKREKVGPIDTEYADWGSESPRYPAIDGLLAPFLTNTGGRAKVVRS
jgi:hypothetical protein